MPETLMMTEADIETTALAHEASDEALIDAAKSFNESIQGHLQRSVEDFWRMGRALSYLYQRRHLKGRWADILDEIGISTTTDNHARRLYRDTTLESLAEYKNKTAALRALGILSTSVPKPSPGSTPTPEDQEENGFGADTSVKLPKAAITSKTALVTNHEADNQVEDDDRTTPIADHHTKAAPAKNNSLEVLATIAARLELLVAEESAVTIDHLAQIDRAMAALDRLREKGVADAA